MLSSVTPGAASRAYLAFVRDSPIPSALQHADCIHSVIEGTHNVNSGGVASDSALSRRMPTPEAIVPSAEAVNFGIGGRAPGTVATTAGKAVGKRRTVYSQLSRIKRLARSTMDG